MCDCKTRALAILVMHAFVCHQLAKKRLAGDSWRCVHPLHMPIYMVHLGHAHEVVPHEIWSGFVRLFLLDVL